MQKIMCCEENTYRTHTEKRCVAKFVGKNISKVAEVAV
jgi:hypothetical protein